MYLILINQNNRGASDYYSSYFDFSNSFTVIDITPSLSINSLLRTSVGIAFTVLPPFHLYNMQKQLNASIYMHHLRFHSLFPSKPFSPFHNVLKNKKHSQSRMLFIITITFNILLINIQNTP